MNKYLKTTLFRAAGCAARVRIMKVTRRRVPGMIPYFETVSEEFHCTVRRDKVDETLERLNGGKIPELKYRQSIEDWVDDVFAGAEMADA